MVDAGNMLIQGLHLAIPETHQAREIETLLDQCFGLERRTKTSYRLREGNSPAQDLARIVCNPIQEILGTIEYWPLMIGPAQFRALLLGPIAIHPDHQNQGIGRWLMSETLKLAQAKGHQLVLLVGDESYYGRHGFRQLQTSELTLPGWHAPNRLLFRELQTGSLSNANGLVLPPWRSQEIYGKP